MILNRYPLTSNCRNGVVFFKVTNIEHGIIDIDASQTGPDAYFAAIMGEMGCWVDSNVTQIMQTGLEHSHVPDVSVYLGIGEQVYK